uniref:Aminopeptidase N-like N-terminal domain-containing protein n=1 Tax=Timema tahoe TaxID=61484 RepID=A0A7R9INH0_9NEOP|nr:unnamed protein product [Timema tahoe]
MRDAPKRRGALFYTLVGTCCLLAVLCVCLIASLVLLRRHLTPGGGGDHKRPPPPPPLDRLTNLGDFMLGDAMATTTERGGGAVRREWEADYRLPATTLPLHYDLLLHPDLEGGTFTGEVAIKLNVTEARRSLVVNCKLLEVLSTRLWRLDVGGGEVALKRTFEYPANEFWVAEVGDPAGLAPGTYSLKMEFSGKLTDKIVGFYRSVYVDPSSQERRLIATSKFQPTYARQAYPCFDEPGFKSQFRVRLVRPNQGYSALSNMDQVVSQLTGETPQGLVKKDSMVRLVKTITRLGVILAPFNYSKYKQLVLLYHLSRSTSCPTVPFVQEHQLYYCIIVIAHQLSCVICPTAPTVLYHLSYCTNCPVSFLLLHQLSCIICPTAPTVLYHLSYCTNCPVSFVLLHQLSCVICPTTPTVLYHLSYCIIGLRTPVVLLYHLSKSTSCPTVPFVQEHQLSYCTICPRAPVVLLYHLSKSTSCPTVPFVQEHQLSYCTICPRAPVVLLYHLSKSTSCSTVLFVQEHQLSYCTICPTYFES